MDYGPENLEWDFYSDISSAEEKFGIDISSSFDSSYVTRLPENAVGATRGYTQWNSGIPDARNDLLLDGHDLPGLPEEMREHVLAHEWVHAKNNRNELYGELLNRGMEPGAAMDMWRMMSYGPGWMKEGATELAALYLDPDSEKVAGRSYPGETWAVSRLLEQNGSHPDGELAGEIEGYMREVRSYTQNEDFRYT